MASFFIGKCGPFDFYKIKTSNDNEMIKIGEEGHIEAEILLLVFVFIFREITFLI
jgi:hypothetical protein